MHPSSVHLPALEQKYQSHSNNSHPHASSSSAQHNDSSLDDEVNPFTLPSEDVFVQREREKQQAAAARERARTVKIWDKGSSSTSTGGAYEEKVAARQKFLHTATVGTSRTHTAVQEHKSPSQHHNQQAERISVSAPGPSSSSSNNNNSSTSTNTFQGRRREKENMADFIAKKRDMFLIQMSLDTKRSEIQKLEEKAQMKEDALKKSELMLEEDAMRFDAFLKENDRKAHDALKRADLETKEKQEKVLEIKKLNAEISKVENEMSKYEEQLLACMKYKDFLDSLTPPEHKAKVEKRKEERKAAAAAQAAAQAASSSSVNGDEGNDQLVSSSHPNNHDEFPTLDEDDDESMYFSTPEQLLDIFAQLEERNLFLIQNVQETEEALDELNTKFEETKKQMEEKTSMLKVSIEDLQGKITAENEKAENLRKRARANTLAGTQQKLLVGLSEKIRSVYKKCDKDPDAQTDTLDMLRDIEQWLEHLLLSINNMDPVKVEQAEKKKNAERRNQIRAIKKEEQKRQYEERLAKSTARATAEVVKPIGKQIMFRSPPLRKKKKKEDVVLRDEEAEELKRFFT